MTAALLASFAIGFVAASPAGPMGLLCLRRVLSAGGTSGTLSALGIACAYGFWAFVAASGVAAIAGWIEPVRRPLEVGVGLFFFLYGLHAVVNRPTTDYPALEVRGFKEFLSTFSVVFLNPATLAMFAALFSIFGVLSGHAGLVHSLGVGLSVFLGAAVFWACIILVASHMRRRLSARFFGRVRRYSAIAILLFGAAILLRAVVAAL